MIVRLALKKYGKNADSMTSAIEKFFSNHLAEHLFTFSDVQEWRKKRLWNEECDMVFKGY